MTDGLSPGEERRRKRALKIQALALEGFTQAEIATRVGMTQRGVGKALARIGALSTVKKAAGKATVNARAEAAAAVLGATPRKRAPGGGRKPSGPGGERVSDYPVVMLRLPVATLAPLKALAAVRGEPVWRVIDTAVVAYLNTVRGAEGEDMRRLAKRELERLTAKREP
jgi:hypothetical protein